MQTYRIQFSIDDCVHAFLFRTIDAHRSSYDLKRFYDGIDSLDCFQEAPTNADVVTCD